MHPPDRPRRLLAIGPLPPGLHASLRERHELVALWEQPNPGAYLRDQRGRFDGGVTMSRHGCADAMFACFPGGVLACFGVGYESVDLDAARRHRVQVSTTPDVLNDCVADLAFALVLAVARRIPGADRHVQAGRWPSAAYPLATRVSGKRLGIVGLGRIGQAIARRASGFDMALRYHGRAPKHGCGLEFEPDLAALARWADFLVLSCPGGAATRHLVSAGVLDALGPDGYLVNIARGSVVDEAALVQAIEQGRIAGAGLDVYADEPNVPAGLLGRDNVVTLPHIAASTRETRHAMERLVLDNLDAYFQTGAVLTPPA
ncbi:hydroxyacid dehydrogenase [Achromobacter sp. RTa]|uniref:2-hydroxyacid dehydrogenase n=1 Tax=Achromobacter sp. RTa TaxID=1532557 RepID=UPI00051051EF|nr:2-hydroxyacid dehydrogenase [Achromobacter sp. RTa]KGD88062.1 hydroxyacid dehydrogenase [Achromobacter sp. RTa]